MKIQLGLAFLFIALLISPAGLYAAADSDQAFFISPSDLGPQLLPPPPAPGSRGERQQIESVISAQHGVSQDDQRAAQKEQRLTVEDITQILGSGVTRDKLPSTFLLLDHIFIDTRRIVTADKNFWKTQRPYLTDRRVKLMIDPIDDSPAYPSGHTAEARVLAEILGILYPDKRELLRERAEAIALHRVEAGVHYPVDLEGGRMLALLIVGGLLQNDDFRDVLRAAQNEISRFR